MERATFEAELRRDGYEIRENTLPAGRSTPDHAHPYDVRLLVLSGEISVTCNGRQQTCMPGDSFVLEANTLHSEQVGPEGVSYVAGRRTLDKV